MNTSTTKTRANPPIIWRKKGEGVQKTGRPPSVHNGLRQLDVQSSIIDTDWQPPPQFRRPQTAKAVVSYWLMTCFETTGRRPEYSAYAMQQQAQEIMAELGYVRTLQVLTFMASPLSKFYQYPYTLRAVRRGNDELTALQQGKLPVKERGGYIGPVGLQDLSASKNKGRKNKS